MRSGAGVLCATDVSALCLRRKIPLSPPDAAAAGAPRRDLSSAGLTVTITRFASQLTTYGCASLRSTTTRVTGGAALCCLTRTVCTPPELTGTDDCFRPGTLLGRSITSRSGCLAVLTDGVTGSVSEISMRTSSPCLRVLMPTTVATLRVACAAQQDTNNKRFASCFCTAVIFRIHLLALHSLAESIISH